MSDTILREGDFLIGGTKGGYRIEKQLGEGGSGITHLATNAEGKYVAIKQLKKSNNSPEECQAISQKFAQEATRIAQLNHPNIVKYELFFYGKLSNRNLKNIPCIIMEYIEGETLYDYIFRKQIVLEKEALDYIQQLIKAVKHIHENNLLHRDIKPSNIMRKFTGEVVVIDFSSAREFVFGKYHPYTQQAPCPFLAPEVYDSTSSNDQGIHSDIYSLAATSYFMLTGEFPEQGFVRFYRQSTTNKDPLVSPQDHRLSISKTVNKAILWGMELKPKKRPQTIDIWFRALEGEGQDKGNLKYAAAILMFMILLPTLGIATLILNSDILRLITKVPPTLSLTPETITKVPSTPSLTPETITKVPPTPSLTPETEKPNNKPEEKSGENLWSFPPISVAPSKFDLPAPLFNEPDNELDQIINEANELILINKSTSSPVSTPVSTRVSTVSSTNPSPIRIPKNSVSPESSTPQSAENNDPEVPETRVDEQTTIYPKEVIVRSEPQEVVDSLASNRTVNNYLRKNVESITLANLLHEGLVVADHKNQINPGTINYKKVRKAIETLKNGESQTLSQAAKSSGIPTKVLVQVRKWGEDYGESRQLSHDIQVGLVVAGNQRHVTYGTSNYKKVQTAILRLRNGTSTNIEDAARISGLDSLVLKTLAKWGQNRRGAPI